jgi:hypothetical protein
MLRWPFMKVTDIFLGLGEDLFSQLLRSISLGKLKTFQLFDRLKTRLHVTKLNTETLRKVAPRCWERLSQPDSEDFASELSQAILISHLDMIKAVLDELEIPHEDGFFAKDLDASKHLTGEWQQRVYGKFKDVYPESLLLFYINHLGWELGKSTDMFLPNAAGANAGPA